MTFWELIKIEFMKVKRSKMIPLIFIAPLPVSYTQLDVYKRQGIHTVRQCGVDIYSVFHGYRGDIWYLSGK